MNSGSDAPSDLARVRSAMRLKASAAGKGPWVAEASGFKVHAGILVRAGDREGLERLCRYGARPPLLEKGLPFETARVGAGALVSRACT